MMLIREADSNLACYLLRVVVRPLGSLAGVCILPTPGDRQAAAQQGILAGAKEKGNNPEKYSEPSIPGSFVHLGYRGVPCCLGR